MSIEQQIKGTRVLISAYAFEPNRGSEPGLGWLWASEAAELGFDVTVLTSGMRHRPAIEAATGTGSLPFRIEYVDFPWPARGGSPFLQHIHYLAWLAMAGLRSAKLRAVGEKYAFCHQVTWASLRYPTFLARNGLLVLGPAGGAERPEPRLMRHFSLADRAKEWFRIASIGTPKWLGLSRLWLRRVDLIGLTSADNLWAVPQGLRDKSFVCPTIALHQFPLVDGPRQIEPDQPIRILFIGRFIAWKGLDLVLATLKQLKDQGIRFSCTLVGEGPLKQSLDSQIREAGLDEVVRLVNWVPREKTIEVYDQHDILLFPSLHDSGGMVVLEAMARGLPVVALKAGGPGVIVTSQSGSLVDPDHGFEAVTDQLTASIHKLSAPAAYHDASGRAVERARDFQSRAVVQRLYRQFLSSTSARDR